MVPWGRRVHRYDEEDAVEGTSDAGAFNDARSTAGTTKKMELRKVRECRMLPAFIEARNTGVQLMMMLPRDRHMLPAFIEARGATGTMVKMRLRDPRMLPASIEGRGAAGIMVKMRLTDRRMLWSLTAPSVIYIT